MKNNYNTKQKKLILDCLISNSNNYVSVEDISKYLEKNGVQVGVTTIYRYLNTLEEKGVLRVENVKNTRRFQYIIEDCKNHYHLKCEKCGKTEHLECDEIITLCSHVKSEHGFIISHKNVIYGTCEFCASNN